MDQKIEVCKAVREITEGKLSHDEQTAMASLLNSLLDAENKQEAEIAALVYSGAVNFLWMAWRIALEEKHQLLDLGG